MKPIWFRVLLLTLPFLLEQPHTLRALAADFRDGFDSPQPTWRVEYDRSHTRLLAQRRSRLGARGEGAAESFQFHTATEGQSVHLAHELPPARMLPDELLLSVWVRATGTRPQLGMRLVFPHQKDPRTGEVLTVAVTGETYTTPGEWQQLRCGMTDKQLRDQIQLLRFQLSEPGLDVSDLSVDGVSLLCPLAAAECEVFLDDLEFGPVVAPRLETGIPFPDRGLRRENPAVQMRLDRLLVDGQPFFPRLAPYHEEDLNGLEQTRLNVLWIPAADDRALLTSLRERGFRATATPPRALTPSGQSLDAQQASLMPFGDETAPILFWYLGTRISGESRDELLAWIKQIRSADRTLQRPFLADVVDQERLYSRHIPLLGTSRHTLNTSLSLRRYRDLLSQSRKLARPGSFVWTWVQTEPHSANVSLRQALGRRPIVVEPEQIRLQVYAALAAGCRGIGYWKTTSLDSNAPGALERRLAMTVLNLELELLEPWLSTGTVIEQVPVWTSRTETQRGRHARREVGSTTPDERRFGILSADESATAGNGSPPHPEIEAAVIRSDRATLLLPVWYEEQAQYVPGQLVAENVEIVVPQSEESALAWEITTTGIRSLRRKRVAGGLKLTLDRLDQTAAILLSSDQTLREQLEKKAASLAGPSARCWVELARAKLHRVRQVDQELNSLEVGQPDAPQLLARSESLLEAAEEALDREDFDVARQHSADSMQALRILERAHWENAVRRLLSPSSSPHTVCFQTLPDHWRMIAQIGRSTVENDVNLLRSGDFEDIDTMLVEGWKHRQNRQEGIRATAELVADAKQGRYCLRLIAVPSPGIDPPTVIQQPPVLVATPPVTVRAGQILHISGWVRLASPIVGNLDGAMISDSLQGPPGVLRWQTATDWQQFQMIREVAQSGPFTLTFTLAGMGEVHFDDLRIVPHTPHDLTSADGGPAEQSAGESPGIRPFDFLNRLPRWNPLAPRDER